MATQKIVERKGANHALHLVLSILTGGLWAFTGWPIAVAMGRRTVTRVQQPYAQLVMAAGPNACPFCGGPIPCLKH